MVITFTCLRVQSWREHLFAAGPFQNEKDEEKEHEVVLYGHISNQENTGNRVGDMAQ